MIQRVESSTVDQRAPVITKTLKVPPTCKYENVSVYFYSIFLTLVISDFSSTVVLEG